MKNKVKVIYTKYLEHKKYKKFCRLSLLNNNKLLIQTGYFEKGEVDKKIFIFDCQDKSLFNKKVTEKIIKGYKVSNDPTPHFIVDGLATYHYNLDMSFNKNEVNIKHILDRIDLLLNKLDDTSDDWSLVFAIRNKLEFDKKINKKCLKTMNELWKTKKGN